MERASEPGIIGLSRVSGTDADACGDEEAGGIPCPIMASDDSTNPLGDFGRAGRRAAGEEDQQVVVAALDAGVVVADRYCRQAGDTA